MIVFGCSITSPEKYREAAEPGFARAREADSVVIANAAAGSLFRSYNLILDRAAQLDGVEAVVLAHQDTEIVDPDFAAKLRAAVAQDDVGVVGCVGAIDVRSIAWWEGSVTWASFTHRYTEFGGGEIEAFTFLEDNHPGYARLGDVDSLDGFLLVLTPWSLANLRFDESLGQIHGYDLDFCLQVREAGKRVLTADFKTVHHHSLTLIDDSETWIEAHKRVAEKWLGRMPGVGLPNWGAASGDDWRTRALQAEAEAGAERLQRVSLQMQAEAREKQFARELAEVTGSTSWRMTRPLRELGLQVRARRAAQRR